LNFLRRRERSTATSMTMVAHLIELRRRLVFSLAAFIVISTVAFFFYSPVLEFVRAPLCDLPARMLGPQGCRLVFSKVFGGFLFRLKMTALVGLIVSMPVWLYQVFAFIVPGLTSKERRYAVPFVLSSVVLFAIGSALAYFTMPTGIRILIAVGGQELVPLLGAEEYLNFVGLMFLGFGLTFELPLVLFFLGLAGVVSVDQLRRQRKAAFVGITALAAIITPSQDPYTMLVLAIPIYLLYELTILLLKIINRRKAARDN
jgi:sec-independent protein translocase protein TatC